jgi:dienelactone hydrolase
MKRKSVVVAGLATLIAAGCGANEEPPSARETFADLLKVSTAAPAVSAKVHDTKTEEGLVIEDISWESLDGETVPAFVVRPEDAEGRLPAILCLHGSSGSRESMVTAEFGRGPWTRPGRDQPHMRMLGWARELARRGYVALAMTQRGLDRRGPPINQQANVMLVRGRTAMGAILHEIRQATSYLTAQPYVDPELIGATGMSFGGITAFYVWLLDDRVAATAPICGGVGSVDVFASEGSIGYHGTYWWVPGMLDKGDQAEFAAEMIPRPLMVWAPRDDIGMPKAGVDRFVERVAPAYEQAGASEAFVVHQPAGEHSFTVEAFEAMVEFFDGVFR